MEKEVTVSYDDFLLDVPPMQRPLVDQIDALLRGHGMAVKVIRAKSGCVVSYAMGAKGHTVANFIFRKKGVFIRVYGDHVERYQDLLATFPDATRGAIAKAGACRRMLDPTKCNPRCQMGNVFVMDGVEHKKCRYNNFILFVDEGNFEAILGLLNAEVGERAS